MPQDDSVSKASRIKRTPAGKSRIGLALAGGLLPFSRRYAIDTFPAYDHEDAAAGFLQLDAMIRSFWASRS